MRVQAMRSAECRWAGCSFLVVERGLPHFVLAALEEAGDGQVVGSVVPLHVVLRVRHTPAASPHKLALVRCVRVRVRQRVCVLCAV